MLTRTCGACSTPLGATDTSCPTCAAPAPVGRPATGRRVVLDEPVAPVPTATPRPAATIAGPPAAPSSAPPPGPASTTEPTITGTIKGPVLLDHRSVGGLGRTLLFRAAGVALVVTLVVGGVVLVGGAQHALVRVVGVLGGLLVLYGVTRRARLRWPNGGGRTLEVRRFQVVAVTGETADCELLGAQVGGELQRGDVVEVVGRRARNGTIRVGTARVLASGAQVRGRPGLGHHLGRAAEIGAVVVIVLASAAVAALLLVARP